MNFSDVAIAFVKGSDNRIHFWYMIEDDGISIMNNSNLNGKSGVLSFFSLCINMTEKTCYQRNRNVILNRAKEYYEIYEKRLKQQARNKYRELSEEDNIKREDGRNRYHNMSKEKKQKLKQCQKKLL